MSPSPSEPVVLLRGGDYEHTVALAGTHHGVRVEYQPMELNALFAAMLGERAFEACEFSAANYMILRARGEDWLQAIPVFPYRTFRHGALVTRRESPLTDLAQLAGKRVGVPDYSMTAAVWVRGLLADDYGIDHRDIVWVTGRKQRFGFPEGARVQSVEADPESLLLAGDIDAMIALAPRDAERPPHERRLRPVLSDPQAAERAYYTRTGLYPIHHCVVLRSDAATREPRLAAAVAAAYRTGKEAAYRRRLGATLVPWGKSHWAQAFELFGGDPLPYGLTADNRRTLATLAEHLVRQGFIATVPDLDRLFPDPHAG